MKAVRGQGFAARDAGAVSLNTSNPSMDPVIASAAPALPPRWNRGSGWLRSATALPGRFALAALAVSLFACGPRTEPYRTAPMPGVAGYAAATPAGHTAYDNRSLAALFVLLTHGLENGDYRKTLQRFEEPVNVGMTGAGANDYLPFLNRLVDQIRDEAAVPIGAGPPPHNLLIRFVPGEEFLPRTSNQCVVIFGQPDWSSYIAEPERYNARAAKAIERQTTMSVFIPDTIEPYKVRECLLEEITQALGTANDLYGLSTSIFNDDNAHTWPTRLDFLMLRVLYDPTMASGMSREETRARAEAVLDRINPQGRGTAPLPPIRQHSFRVWRRVLLGHSRIEDPGVAIAQARELAAVARRIAPNTAYDCTGATFSASVARSHDAPDQAELIERAIAVCTDVHGADDIRVAQLRLKRSYVYLDAERYADARREVEAILPTLLAHALDGSVAAAYIVQTAAAWRMNDPDWDGAIIQRAAAWSAFAYGDDHELTKKLRPE